MTRSIIPGALCASVHPLEADRGTSACWFEDSPGPIGWGDQAWLTAEVSILQDPDVGFLFSSCRAPERGVSDAAFASAARQLDSEVAAIRAVAEVESARGAFDEQGRPTILFERHYFSKLTAGAFDREHADISNVHPGNWGSYADQYKRLERAFRLAPTAALKSASCGRFQIMGANHSAAGFATVRAFVTAIARAEAEHLNAFVHFVASDPRLHAALKKRDWTGFASVYNGPDHLANDYGAKLQLAYDKFAVPPGAARAPTRRR